VQDGSFSITNYGVFGSLMGTPIIHQPQVAILGVGSIKKRAVVVANDGGNDSVVIRSMMYITLSFDHRIVDGATGGQFLATVKSNLEKFKSE
jgi:pyruvate dehydrogenase E2 component (dihydrolipoamide acetyltransferase)